MSNYKNLIVWKKSIELTVKIYEILKNYPKEELFWLVSQMKRSVISIPSNIAEWYWRNWKQEYKQFLWIAKGSSFELETQLLISKELWFINDEKFNELNNLNSEIIKILTTIINKI